MPLLLFALWLILNGRITLELCVIGVILVGLLTAFMAVFMGYRPDFSGRRLRKIGLVLEYGWVLVVEIFKANLHMVRIVLDRSCKVRQALVYVDVEFKTDFARMLLANSITLTPGTITVSVDGNRFTVHCLSEDLIEGIEQSKFVELLRRLEA